MPGAVPTSYYTGPTTTTDEPPADPGHLRNALAAIKALEASTGSGLKTVAAEKLEQRLQTCQACQHHTGLRCRLCAQFTLTKARLPYETCPAGKWPAVIGRDVEEAGSPPSPEVPARGAARTADDGRSRPI